MNNAHFTLGIILALVFGAVGGYVAGQNSARNALAPEIATMTAMMASDGERMRDAGGLMMQAGTMMQERATRTNDQDMLELGKDLSARGMRHEADGKSMMEGDMMGMTADGAMENMPGMDMEGMDHGTMGR